MASPAPKPAPQRPLPSLDMGARLNADQARDRFSAANDNAGGPANDNAFGVGDEETTFLDPGVRSYTRSEETEAERERERQAGMTRTRRQFLTPDGERAAEAVGPSESRTRTARPAREEIEASNDDAAFAAQQEEAMAQQMALAAALDREQMLAARRRAAAEEARGALDAVAMVRKTSKGVRRVVKLVQLALAETFVPLITLFLQMNAELLNKWIFKINIPLIAPTEKNPKLEMDDVATGGVDCACCCSCLLILAVLFILTVLVWGFTNPLDTISLGIDALMGSLFN